MDDKTERPADDAPPINNLTPDLRDAIRSIDATGEDGSNPGVEVENDEAGNDTE